MGRRHLTFKERVAIGRLKDKREQLKDRAAAMSNKRLAELFGVHRRTIDRE